MFRDPLYRQIRRGLREIKDGNLFEACANDLLSKIYPSLAPREGGGDAGLDGVVAADKGSIQLICTTGEDVLENLSQSIESNIKNAGTSYACIVATSQRLTNPRKRSLESRAKEWGRSLIQIYDQAAMAQLVYRDTRWLKELLGLAGTPASISLFPITTRPLFDMLPLGRDDDLAKIINLSADTVLVGQPGSGKTHFLFTAAKKTKGRFVVDEDIGAIANDVRSVQPHFLIVDDAHSRLEFLKRLRLLRQQINADFKIVASCWPGQENAVCAVLQMANDKCHVLEALAQKQIKDVILSQKIFGPEHLVAELIHQSQGKPGLTVTLCRLCWESGNARDVVLGTALARDVRLSFEPLLGHKAIHMLACFSIGGEKGMTLEAVAHLLSENVFAIKRMVEQLAAAGILEVSIENRISVHPFRLRQALVRDMFLTPPVMDLTPHMKETPDLAATTQVLIEAKLMGGILSDDILRPQLQELANTSEERAFNEYARLGKNETEWILNHFPNKLKAVAPVALHTSPAEALKMLLNSAVAVREERVSQGWSARDDDILREIKHWILSAAESSEAFERRKLLATSLTKWRKTNSDKFVGILAAELIISIRHENTSTPPGEPMTVTLHRGTVNQDQIARIASLWPDVLPILCEAGPSQESSVANIFHEWIHPDFHGNKRKDYEKETRKFARQMMADLLEASSRSWTMHHHLHNYAEKLGLVVKIDPIAEVLYPPRELGDWKEEQKLRQTNADKLAFELSKKDPVKVADELTTVEEQARAANISYPSWGWQVCLRIPEIIENPLVWLKAFFDRGAPAYMLEGFFEKIVASDRAEAEKWVLLALKKQSLQMLMVSLVLKHSFPESSIWLEASPLFKDWTGVIDGCVLRKEVSNNNLRALLNHPNGRVAGATAASLWGIGNEGNIPAELFQDWKTALVKYVDEQEHILEKIFPRHPDIAFDWINWRLEEVRNGTRSFWAGSKYDRALPSAIEVLNSKQKRELIDRLPYNSSVAELVRFLVGHDLGLYAHLLSREDLKEIRLDPLRLDSDFGPQAENVIHLLSESWEKMAIAALDKGFSECDVFAATQQGGYSWSGNLSSMFAARLAPFEKLLKHTDFRLRKVGKIGCERFAPLRDENLVREKRAAIRGELA